jgi:Fusaric acid resistance protein family
LDGNRTYGAVLCGYTVALVAVTQIDAPQSVFSAGVDRGAAIVVGIAALAVVSTLFATPNVHTSLFDKLAAAQQRVRAFALTILRGRRAEPTELANLLRTITALHPDITALAAESSNGSTRDMAARSAAVALVAEACAANSLAALPTATRLLREAVADSLGKQNRALQPRLQQQADIGDADPRNVLFVHHALDLIIEDQRAQDAIEDLKMGRHPSRRIRTPIYRSHRAAARNGLRAFLAVLTSSTLLALGGWPLASLGIAIVGVIVALSAGAPSARALAATAVIGVPLAGILAGVTEFLILDGVDEFPLLAIGIAPVVVTAALLLTVPNPKLASIAFQVLVFFPVILSPANPQNYSAEAYLFSGVIVITSVLLLFVLQRTLLPTSDALLRRWYLTSARTEMDDLLAGNRFRWHEDEALFRDADRIGQLAELQPVEGDDRHKDVRQALDLCLWAAAVRRVRTALDELSARAGVRLAERAYSDLAAYDPIRLRRSASDLTSLVSRLDDGGRAAIHAASLSLTWAAFLIETHPPIPIHTRRTSHHAGLP